MIKACEPDFQKAFRRGLGRALTYIRQHAADPDVRQIVIDGLLHHRAFEPQCEGSRSTYLLEAAQLLSPPLDVTALIGPVLKYARYSHRRSWDLQQCIDLLAALGQNGNEAAAQVLRRKYQRFCKEDTALWEMLAGGLIELDGLAGLKRVLLDQLRFKHQKPGQYHCDFLWLARESIGEAAVNQAMPDILDSIPGLADQQYREEIQQAKRRKARQEASQAKVPRPQAYGEIWSLIRQMLKQEPRRNSDPAFRITRFSSTDLSRLAQDLSATDDVQTLRLLLNIFSAQGVPAALERLLELRRHSDEWVSFRAYLALARIRHPNVRKVALELLQRSSKDSYLATDLLRLNYQEGDAELIQAELQRLVWQRSERSLGKLHSFLMALNDVVSEHPTPELLTLLAQAYPHQPCSMCREKMVMVLLQHGALPSWLNAEARLDANPGTRKLEPNGFSGLPPRDTRT